MAQATTGRSPLMNSISNAKARALPDWESYFFARGLYYRALQWRRLRGVDERGREVDTTVEVGHYFVCESYERRPFTDPPDDDLTGGFATLLTQHPMDKRVVRLRLWTSSESSRDFERIDNAMEILAIASATGLTL